MNTTTLPPVKIDTRLVGAIGIREWGMPGLCVPGKLWRSENHGTVTCMLAGPDPNRVKIDTRPMEIVEAGEDQWMPDEWRVALWSYAQEWPESGSAYGPWLAITEAERNAFLRKLGARLVGADEIGCRMIANMIGELAAWGYRLPSDG